MDQIRVTEVKSTKTATKVIANPRARGFKDLIVKGGQFYAVYDPDTHLWSRSVGRLSELIDRDISEYIATHSDKTLTPEYMDNMSNGQWNRYLSQLKNLDDSSIMLDQKVIFDNDEVDRDDYASFKLPYDLIEGPTPNYDRLMETIYDPDERRKLEWGIGLIVDGKDQKRIQKFFAITGAPGTGKSTILNIIQELFGKYVSFFNAKELGQGYQFATAAFKNAPLIAIQSDGDLSKIDDNSLLNTIVSHEYIKVNEKGVKQYDIPIKTMLFMASNKPVKITDSKSGLIRRLIDVYPSGRKLSNAEYFEAMDGIKFELGAIAHHCREVYQEMGPNAYGNYIPTEMVARTNDMYSFLSSVLDQFEDDDHIDGLELWRQYKVWCDEGNVTMRMKRDDFLFELSSYFNKTTDNIVNGRKSTRNTGFEGIRWDKFEKVEKPKLIEARKLELNSTDSTFDHMAQDWPAQYAADNPTGGPRLPWDQVTTTLKDVDTTKLHWVRVPENHIVIDFDLKGDDGEKSLERNLAEAAKYPPTYAELSKSGKGVHLHYIYDGDVTRLKPLIDINVECKVYRGKSALRRKLSTCNDLEVAHISSGLPLKGDKTMINEKAIKDEQHLRNLIKGNLRKEYCPGTKPSIDFICKLLDEAYESGIQYNVEDMRLDILNFAMNSTHNRDYCMKVVANMKLRSDEPDSLEPPKHTGTPDILTFYDVEVFPNLFMICFKDAGDEKDHPVKTLINPDPKDVRKLCGKALVGFNNRRYDNHMLYAWGWLGYDNQQLYNLSQDIVAGGPRSRNAMFQNAYNISYTDIYDFSAKKQSLKKWEIELGIDHHELGMPWDKPVDPKLWDLVQSYCEDDVRATEAVFNHLREDFVARQGLANLSGLTPNDSTNQHTAQIIFGDAKNPQKEFPFPDLSETFPGYTFDKFADKDHKSKYLGEYPSEGGYVWVYGMANGDNGPYYGRRIQWSMTGKDRLERYREVYRSQDMDFDTMHPDLAKRLEGYSYDGADQFMPELPDKTLGGMFGNVGLLDVTSLHPSSLEDLNFFGPYTKRFSDIKAARVDIKHGDLESARRRMDGALAPLLKEGENTKSLAQALKIVINSVYGLTSAKFPTKFNDVGNGANDRNADNKVAKRGALFMLLLKQKVMELGYTVVHIKTDSIKIADIDEYVVTFVNDMGAKYGYGFELEAIYDKMCIVNKATYIAHHCYGDDGHDAASHGGWAATGAQFAVPYVFKTLFSHETIDFKDLCETKSATTSIYLDFNEGLPEDEHRYDFVGKVSAFSPVQPGCGGGLLVRDNGNGGYAALSGTKGYRWKESSVLRDGHKQDEVDYTYYEHLADEARNDISQYGDFDWLVSGEPYVSPNPGSNDLVASLTR